MKIEQDHTPYMSDILKDMGMGNVKEITIYKTSANGKTTTIDNPIIFGPETLKIFKKGVGDSFVKLDNSEAEPC